jgi:hypothetical protein
MLNRTQIILIFLLVFIVTYVIAEGYIFSPRTFFMRMTRKKIYQSRAQVEKQIAPNRAPEIDWEITSPNMTMHTMILGGLGNTLMAYSVGVEACRRLGMRPPNLVAESEGEFDFHNITPSKFGFLPTSINEILPWASTLIINSGFNLATMLKDKSLWMANDYNKISKKRNIVQITNYEIIEKVSDETCDFVRRSINKEIYDYIEKHYGDLSNSMAVHLRMGQPTDYFAPPHPEAEDILQHYNMYKPERVLIFTDNRSLAEEIIEKCNIPNVLWVGESGPIELFMVGMCGSAVISHSTFSVMGCRLFKRKNVSISLCESHRHFENMLDESWTILSKDVKYFSKLKTA